MDELDPCWLVYYVCAVRFLLSSNQRAYCFKKYTSLALSRGAYDSCLFHAKRTRPPVLLAGLPRCGSTWVGRILALHPGYHYHFEPLNPNYSGAVEEHHRARNTPESYVKLDAYWKGVLQGNLFGWMSLLYQPPWSFIRAQGILIKDVHVLFSLPMIPLESIKTILLVRHPCAIADSHIRRGLNPDLEQLAQDLSGDPITEERSRLFREALVTDMGREDAYFRMGLYWEMAYSLAFDFLLASGNATILNYESLCGNQVEEWEGLATNLNITITPKMWKEIKSSTQGGKESYTSRDSKQIRWGWRSDLTAIQIERVLAGVHAAGSKAFSHFYPKDDK
ncbi:hypothetical protein P3T73_01460 [Kiritimatiellota bacterium B12222]|nr:hypothetical protein P3T73_01460 [Kiritimatiellota bacterium B12222]